MMKLNRPGLLLSALVAAFALSACGGDDLFSPPDGGRVSLSVVVPTNPAGAASLAPAFDIEQTDGANTLILEEVQLVLREVELESEAFECEESEGLDDSEGEGEDDGEGDDDGCEEFEAGPFLVDLPLDGEVETILGIDVPAGTYDEIEFEIHKSESDDQAFVSANPDFVDISILVRGRYNGESFEFTQDLDAEQEVELSPPLVVGEGAQPTNVTLVIDVATWFVAPDGISLIDPRTAGDSGPNEDLVEDNIKNSIHGFEDEDEDGEDDDEDDDD